MEKSKLSTRLIVILFAILIAWVSVMSYKIIEIKTDVKNLNEGINNAYNSMAQLWLGVYNWTEEDLANQLNCSEYNPIIGEDAKIANIGSSSLSFELFANGQQYLLYYFKDKTIECSTKGEVIDCREIFCES